MPIIIMLSFIFYAFFASPPTQIPVDGFIPIGHFPIFFSVQWTAWAMSIVTKSKISNFHRSISFPFRRYTKHNNQLFILICFGYYSEVINFIPRFALHSYRSHSQSARMIVFRKTFFFSFVEQYFIVFEFFRVPQPRNSFDRFDGFCREENKFLFMISIRFRSLVPPFSVSSLNFGLSLRPHRFNAKENGSLLNLNWRSGDDNDETSARIVLCPVTIR